MDFYMVISNRDSLNYYPHNAPTDFRIHAPNTSLKGRWYVGLCELSVEAERECEMLVFSDICAETFIGDEKKPLLRRLLLNAGRNDVAFQHVMYIPVQTHDFHSFRVFVESTPSPTSDITCLLHFKKYPFI